jgi:hypothetical protein
MAAALTKIHNRLPWLLACWAVAQGAAPRVDGGCVAAAAAAAALFETVRRMAAFGGRDGLPRSLASVYAAAVCRFLGGVCGTRRGVYPAMARPLHRASTANSIAVSTDTKFLVHWCITHSPRTLATGDLFVIELATGRPVASKQLLPDIRKVAVTPDDHVYVTDGTALRCFTLLLDECDPIDVGTPVMTVAASADFVAATSFDSGHICVFSRATRDCVQRLDMFRPSYGLCFLPSGRELAVALDSHAGLPAHIAVVELNGAVVRRFGAHVLCDPSRVTCSAAGEFVVVDNIVSADGWSLNSFVVVFDEFGDVATTTTSPELDFGAQDVAVLGETVLECDSAGHFFWLR